MEDIRMAIDRIDRDIVSSIALRAKYVTSAAQFKVNKAAVRDEKRVRQVIESKAALAEKEGISPDLISGIYEMMINFFIDEEIKEWEKEKS